MYIDPLVVLLAFGFGYFSSRIGLPPLVGYLLAGFVMSTQGYTSGPAIQAIADAGVTILLFTIGLKLRLRNLMRPEVWAGASLHMLVTVTAFTVALLAASTAGLSLFSDMELKTAVLIAFALSFSSTVFAVKILEESGRSSSLNGRTAIGVLIIQDIFAVLFLAFSTGKIPSPWAVVVLMALPVARTIFMHILNRIGHGELQVLFGFFLAFVAGAYAFDLVGLKADLGALVIGMLLAPHSRSLDMARALYSIKDFLLVGFFLNIGLSGLPTLQILGIAVILVLVIPFKAALFCWLFTRFKLKARTSFITALNLGSYSEFGLIVAGIAAGQGWLSKDWLLTLALALSISFLVSSPVNRLAEDLFDRIGKWLRRFESEDYHPDEEPYQAGTWQIAIFGMGRVGTGAYEYFTEKFGPVVIGFDFNAERVDRHLEQGRQVLLADATDVDFWRRIPQTCRALKLYMLTMPNLESQLYAIGKIRKLCKDTPIAAMAQFDDEVEILKEAGVSTSFNVFAEAGFGLASHTFHDIDQLNIEYYKAD